MKGLPISVLVVIFFTGSVTAEAAETYNVGDIEPYNMFEDAINKTLEQLRPLLPDPLTIEKSFNLTFKEDILNGFLEISKPTLAGLQGFQVPFLNFAIIGLRLNMTLVLNMDVSLEYLLDTIFLESLLIYGGGDAGVHLSNLEMTISTQVDVRNGTKLRNFYLQIGLANTSDFFINGFLFNQNSSILLGHLLTEIFVTPVVTFINENQAMITEKISPIVEDIINQLLSGNKTITDDSLRESFEEFLHDERLHDLVPDLVTTLSQDSSEDISHLIYTFVRDFAFEMLSTHKIDAFLGDFELLKNHQIKP